MVCMEQQAISFSVTTLGWLCIIVSCILPVWRVTFPEDETNPDASIWEGLWHMFKLQKNSWIQCTLYDTRPAVTQDLSVSQVFMIICIIGTWLGLLLFMIRDECLKSVKNEEVEGKIMKAASVMFLGVVLLVLMSLSWMTYNISHGFSNPLLGSTKKTEMGASLYLAWASSLLLLLGSTMLCFDCPSHSDTLPLSYIVDCADRPSGANSCVLGF
ncbi:claudin-13 isoform X2 [Cricetulus griseus]|uniref:Claudin-13 isoform X2 n=1 Tax=Cricetulus griseus TaxID=10029 RepID=A0A9J7GZ83_CRIGR|nr:claudin-13 isoform X2 [Cricetulus griseus]XP_035299277.1 claudin-13 isoform X2 [Cricetulus griseus]